MDNLKSITNIVLHILEEEPATRNSDHELYFHVCKVMNPYSLSLPFGAVLKARNELGIPSFESVGRIRRKVVERHPELLGCATVECGRANNEVAFREYAKGVTE